ncbi:hypothetical protein O181_051943 [Austropuccinia psidii MF-1]|uniref:Uncharacterized protein n=1 Tax=Austropuccinia psidii MF-1 TaxID=1389203 RepID=A0A9Q3HNV6_9BASI|nr:hypothetical protein [Austropuccinia psidii MF-1]
MNETFDYEKHKWDKSNNVPDFKLGDLNLGSNFNFNHIKEPKKLINSYSGCFFIVSLHGTNPVQKDLSVELENKHPKLPVSLIKPYQQADKEFSLLKGPTPLTVSLIEHNEDQKINKVIKKGDSGVKIKENILSDIQIQYMKLNGWQNQIYLNKIKSCKDLDMKEGH